MLNAVNVLLDSDTGQISVWNYWWGYDTKMASVECESS